MDPAKIATLAAGGRPLDLTPEEACAFDVATALLGGGVLPGATYRAARDLLGQGALTELVLWVGTYAQVAITLNAFDVPSEEAVRPMTTMYVTYPGDAGTRFDRDYYVRHHLPLVMACWGPLGLESCAAFWPADADAGTIASANAASATRRRCAPRWPRPRRRA